MDLYSELLFITPIHLAEFYLSLIEHFIQEKPRFNSNLPVQ